MEVSKRCYCVVVSVKRENEWNAISISPQPFVVLTVDQFVGRGGGPLERQKQDSHVNRKTGL